MDKWQIVSFVLLIVCVLLVLLQFTGDDSAHEQTISPLPNQLSGFSDDEDVVCLEWYDAAGSPIYETVYGMSEDDSNDYELFFDLALVREEEILHTWVYTTGVHAFIDVAWDQRCWYVNELNLPNIPGDVFGRAEWVGPDGEIYSGALDHGVFTTERVYLGQNGVKSYLPLIGRN